MEPTNSTNENQSRNGRKPPVLDKEESSGIATAQSPPSSPNPPHQHRRRNWILFGLLGIGLVAGATFGYRWWHYASVHESTDDAYVTSYIHPINARINGTVVDIGVDDNQQVSQGTLLVKLDPRDYDLARQRSAAALASAEQQAAVAQANISVTATNAVGQTTEAQGNINAAAAVVSTAQAALAEAQAGVPAAQAQLAQVKANLTKAELDYKRYTALSVEGAVPQEQAGQTHLNLK
jgi:membrane fusion protein (multidrug efflux system)